MRSSFQVRCSRPWRVSLGIPGSRLEIVQGAGHFPHVDEPVRFPEILTDFMRTTEPSADASASSSACFSRAWTGRSIERRSRLILRHATSGAVVTLPSPEAHDPNP